MLTHLESEAAIVAQAQAGDENAFVKIYSRHSRQIYRMAFNITQDSQDAEDVLEVTFLRVFRHLDQFRSESRISTWLKRIAANEAFAKLRRRRSQNMVSHNRTRLIRGGAWMTREIESFQDEAGEGYGKIEWQGILSSVIN